MRSGTSIDHRRKKKEEKLNSAKKKNYKFRPRKSKIVPLCKVKNKKKMMGKIKGEERPKKVKKKIK